MARVAVAATAPFGADVLERLAAHHEISALLTRPDAQQGRGRRIAPPPAKLVAERLGVPVLQPERPAPGLELGAPVVVVCAYGLLIPEELLEEREWLNVHPSLLPRWRGAAPVERAILAGDDETGVTIHETVKELDAGPIAAQRAFPIGVDDDAGRLRAGRPSRRRACSTTSSPTPRSSFVPQAAEGMSYAEKITSGDRRLDLGDDPVALVRRVRALAPHIGARAELHGRPVTVWRARVGVDGAFEPLEVQPDGGKRMEATAWVRGLR